MVFLCYVMQCYPCLTVLDTVLKMSKTFLFFGTTYKAVIRSDNVTQFLLKKGVMAHPNLGRFSNGAHSFQENLKSHHFATIYESRRSCSCSLVMLISINLTVARANLLLGRAGHMGHNYV